MASSADPLLLDTSAAVLLADPRSAFRPWLVETIGDRSVGLAGHATYEVLSVLTRLPAPRRLSVAEAGQFIAENFPHPHFLDAATSATLVEEFARLGVTGGAIFDGLVGAAARDADLELLSCDQRAATTDTLLRVRAVLPRA